MSTNFMGRRLGLRQNPTMRMRSTPWGWLTVLLVAGGLLPWRVPAGSTDHPRFRFGVVSDIQYADKADQGARAYRAALPKLEATIAALNRQRVAFVVNLGDVIDGNGARSAADLQAVTAVLERLDPPWRHVLGNHCLEVDRPTLMRALELKRSWYEFRKSGWRFLVLDGMDVSRKAPRESPKALLAQEHLRRNPRLPAYNGAIGPEQLDWFRQRLAAARSARDRVMVLCHHPVLPASSDTSLLLWNWEEVLSVVVEARCVVSWFNGHDHRGGYAERNGVHFVSFPGLIESPGTGPDYGVVEVFDDRFVIQGTGSVFSRSLRIRPGAKQDPGL